MQTRWLKVLFVCVFLAGHELIQYSNQGSGSSAGPPRSGRSPPQYARRDWNQGGHQDEYDVNELFNG